MIDFWEAMGRIAHDPKFQLDFLATQPKKPHAIKEVTGPTGDTGLDIPGDAYKEIQKFFLDKLSCPCLSLMAAGELRFGASIQNARTAMAKLPSIIEAAKPGVDSPSTGYFIGLGLIVSDLIVRTDLESNMHFMPRMSKEELAQIKYLCNDKNFLKETQELHAACWGRGCNVRLVFWDGHLHPRAADEYGADGPPEPAAKAAHAAK